MSAIDDCMKWYENEGVYKVYSNLVEQLLPTTPGIIDPNPESTLAAIIFDRTGLPPSEFSRLAIQDRIVWLRKAIERQEPCSKPESLTQQGAENAEVIQADDGGQWSKSDTPSRWGKRFGFSAKTFVRHVESGKIRAKYLSDKSYQVHIDDLPTDQK